MDPATSKWLERVRSSSKNCGEINEKHGRLLAACLYRLALLSAGALEIGTFYGCGSTLVIAKGLMDSNSSSAHLWTVESMETRAAFAQRFVTSQSLPVTVINGIGAPAHMILPRDDLLRYLPNGQAERGSLAAFQGWHDGEKKFADQIAAAGKAASIRRLCAVDDRNIELAFLDGAEMYGLADLHEVLRYCPKVRFIAMDDVKMFKNHQSVQTLLKPPGWGFTPCIQNKPGDDRPGGWAVFARDNEDPQICSELRRIATLL